MSKPFVAQWGILGCGWISSEFVKDACRDPKTREVEEVTHAIAAVGSRSKEKAEKFIKDFCPDGAAGQSGGSSNIKTQPYGSYKEVVEDPNVHIVYVGTMNVSHYEDARLALEAGKHCLLEKPATLNAAEWADLSKLAKSKSVFLMEAVWTRFNPVLLAVQKAVHGGDIGDIRCLYSDHSMDAFTKRPDTDRLLSPKLAGGPLLDIGPYPMVWTMMMLFRHPKNDMTPPEKIGSTMLLGPTGVDIATSFSMTFPKINAMAYCSTNLLSATDRSQHTRIVGSKGEIRVQGHTSRPQSYTIRKYVDPTKEGGEAHPEEKVDMSFGGFGLYWEADAVARCLRDGLLECPTMTHKETQMTMEIFDKIRKEGGYKFLPGLEKVQAE